MILHRDRAPRYEGIVRAARAFLVHLRLPYQMALASTFLLGYVLAGGRVGPRGVLAFAIVHVCLYGGAAAFSSCFDRDEGKSEDRAPPPSALPGLLAFAISLQTLGLALALSIGIDFLAIYAALIVLSIGYSHPIVRWKGRPLRGLFMVAIGRGILGFDLGVLAAGTGARYLQNPELILGSIAAALVAAGLRPLAQVHRIEEDRRRGDRTFAVAFGARRSYRLSLALLAPGWAGMTILFAWRVGPWQAALVAASGVAACLWIALRSRGIETAAEGTAERTRLPMLLAHAASGGVGLLLLIHLFGWI